MISPDNAPAFALNHMVAPDLPLQDFFELAARAGVADVEIRNDNPTSPIPMRMPPAEVRRAAGEAGVRIATINALQRFNDWSEARADEARALSDYAAACGARALVLVPVNDGSGRGASEREDNLKRALEGLLPILREQGVAGYVEPLGFSVCSLRSKKEAAEAIGALGAEGTFGLVHDTFHHHLAGEPELFPRLTRLVHVSGVDDPAVAVDDMRDPHRVLVGEGDRLDTVGQIAVLCRSGYAGLLSFEPFAQEVHALKDKEAALAESMAFILGRLAAGRAAAAGGN